LRKQGIISLCDHEIGTHYYRAFNDGNLNLAIIFKHFKITGKLKKIRLANMVFREKKVWFEIFK
jgi:hypothetical protein